MSVSEQQLPKNEIHDQIGKLKTDLFKCIGTIESIQSKCRSRQHPAPAQSCQTCVDEMAIFCQGCPNLIAHLNGEIKKNVAEHDAAIARKAREDVLDLIEKWITEDACPPGKKKGKRCDKGCAMCFVESLRSTQQQAGGEQHE